MSDKFTATFECKNCGGTVLQYADNPTDDTIVKCKSCGMDVARYGELKAQLLKFARNQVRSIAKRSFGKTKRALNRR